MRPPDPAAHSNPTPAKIELLNFDMGQVTADTPIQGQVETGLRWRDARGENLVVFSAKDKEYSWKPGLDVENEGARDRHVFAAHYLRPADGGPIKLDRLVKDRVVGCQFDLIARFLKKSFTVMDLDKDGVGEVSFAYELGCTSDVSPNTMKLLTLEAGEKYILRGSTRVDAGHGKYDGGDYKIDPSFEKGAAVFLEHAKRLWKKSL